MEFGLESAVAIENGNCHCQNLLQFNDKDVRYWGNGKQDSGNEEKPHLVGKWITNNLPVIETLTTATACHGIPLILSSVRENGSNSYDDDIVTRKLTIIEHGIESPLL